MVENNSMMADGRHFENRYIAISQWKIIGFSWNFVRSRFRTGWSSRDQKWKSCIPQSPSSTERISCYYLHLVYGIFFILLNLFSFLYLRQVTLAGGSVMFSTCPFFRPSVRPSVCLSVRPSVCPSVCLFVCYQTREHDILTTNEPILIGTTAWSTRRKAWNGQLCGPAIEFQYCQCFQFW